MINCAVLFQCCELCCKWTYWFRSNHLEWGSVWGCMSGEFGKNILYKLWVSWLAYFGLKSMSHSPWWRLPCWLTQVSHITLGFLSSPADIRGSACTVGALWLADKSVHCTCGALWLADALHGGWHKLLNDDVAHGRIKGLMMCHIYSFHTWLRWCKVVLSTWVQLQLKLYILKALCNLCIYGLPYTYMDYSLVLYSHCLLT